MTYFVSNGTLGGYSVKESVFGYVLHLDSDSHGYNSDVI